MKTTQWMAALLAAAALALTGIATPAQDKTAAASATPRAFATPDDAAAALVAAVRASDAKAMLEVIGPAAKSWLFSGDKVADSADWKKFLSAYDQKHALVRQSDAAAVLHVGADDWPFPAPLVKKTDQWTFDAETGREEIINRRVGRNELDTIQTLLAVVDAQREYARSDADRNSLISYAARFRSSPGKKDGLYWPTKAGEPSSPLGPLFAEAAREGYKYSASKPTPYHGYLFRMLTAQGKDAAGGAYDYLVKGVMFGGFAAVGYPAVYGNSGVKTFIVNHDGVVYERDLGSATATEAVKMTVFNPGKGWTKAP